MAIQELEDYPEPGGIVQVNPELDRPRARTVRRVGILALITLALLTIFLGNSVMIIVTALLLGTVLRDLACTIEKHTHLSTSWSLVALLVLLLGFAIGFGFLVAPQVAKQADQLTDTLPDAVDKATSWLRQWGWGGRILDQAEQAFSGSGSSGMLRRVGSYFSATLSAFADFFVILVLGIFFAAGIPTYKKGFLRLFPTSKRPRAEEVLHASAETVGAWLRGQLIAMAFLATVAYIGFIVIGVPLALILAVIVGILNIIPYIGPILSLIPIGLISLSDSPATAAWALGYFLTMQIIEGNLVTPLIQKRAVDVPPVVLLGAQIILGSLFGFFGILLAAPIIAIAMVLVKMLYLEDVLGQQTEHPGQS